MMDKAKAAVTGKASGAHSSQAGTETNGTGLGSGTTAGVGSGMTGTGVASGTTGTGTGGAHPVVTNSNLSSTPILGGEGVTSAAGHTGSGTGHAGTGHAGTGHAGTGHTGTETHTGTVTHTGVGGSGTASGPKGSQYDATGGQVDDRSMLQKGMDAIKPGSQVGQHGKK